MEKDSEMERGRRDERMIERGEREERKSDGVTLTYRAF